MTREEMKDRISMALKDPILQQGFELICKNLVELQEENKLLKLKLDALDGLIPWNEIANCNEQIKENLRLKQENEKLKTDYGVLSCSVGDFGELQDKLEDEQRKNNGLSGKLANAVLIIKNLLHLWEDVMTEDTVKSMIKEAKRFLKEAANAE